MPWPTWHCLSLSGASGLIALALAYVAKSVKQLAPLSTGAALYLLGMRPGIYIRQIVPSILAALLMALAVCLARDHWPALSSFASLALLAPAGAAFYFLILMMIDRKAVMEMVSMARHTAGRG